MPWCPVCKNEYREGIKICADCGADLVDELEAETKKSCPIYMENEEQANKFVDYLKYSGLEAEVEVGKDGSFGILVNESDFDVVRVSYKAYIKSESERFDEALSKATDVEKQAYMEAAKAQAEQYRPAGVYVSQSETAKDMSATAKTFIFFAIVLAVLAPLCYFGVLPFFNKYLPALILLLAMAVGCILIGISSLKRAKVAKENSVEEEKNNKVIETWLKDNAYHILNDDYNPIDNTLPEELLYLERADRLKEALTKEFGKLDSAYVETIIDDFYNEHFGA